MAWFAGLLLFIFTSGVQAQGMMWENFQTKAKAAVERGEYRDAKEYYRQSIEQFVIVKGSETAPSTLVMAMITMEYARVLQELGELPEATKQAMQGVALYSGSERPRLAAIRANVQLGQLYEAQGCYEEALTQYQQAMTMARRFTGGDPNGICAITMHLAHLAEAREQSIEAQRLYQEVITQLQLTDDAAMIIYEEAINSSIRIAVAEKNTVFAERMLTRAVDTVKLLRGKEHQDMGYIWRVHARYHLAIGRTGTADEEFQRGLQLVENALGSDHPRFYQFGITLGEFYLQIKQAAKAVIILTRVLKLQEQHPPADKTVFARTLYLVAAANLQNGCAADAVPYAARALALVDQCFGTESQMTVSYLQIYATVVKKSGREDEYSKIKPRLEAMHLQ